MSFFRQVAWPVTLHGMVEDVQCQSAREEAGQVILRHAMVEMP